MRSATFALFVGIAYLSAGIVGLIPAELSPAPPDAPPVRYDILYGYMLGVFPVNVLHSIVHLAIGAWGISAWRADHHFGRGMGSPKLYARSIAMFYGLLALLGLLPATNTLFGLMPIYGHDVWLHAVTAAAAGYFGWRTENVVERRGATNGDRRQDARPVDVERRLGHADRRAPGSEV
jgi:hypothetical protein